MFRFAVLLHDFPAPHYDLLLEDDGVCLTWRVPIAWDWVSETECERLRDHRLLYLDYEGEVSGGRGTVSQVDRGTFVANDWSGEGGVAVFSGERLNGTWTLTAMPDVAAGLWHFAPRN